MLGLKVFATGFFVFGIGMVIVAMLGKEMPNTIVALALLSIIGIGVLSMIAGIFMGIWL